MADPIKKITLKDGTVRYRFVVDIGRDPETGRRQQKTFTFDTKREARAEYDKIRHRLNEGTYIRPTNITVSEYLDGLAGRCGGTPASGATRTHYGQSTNGSAPCRSRRSARPTSSERSRGWRPRAAIVEASPVPGSTPGACG